VGVLACLGAVAKFICNQWERRGEECVQKFFSVDSANVGAEANALYSGVWISP